MKFPPKLSILNASSIALIIWMIFILMTNPKNQGGDGLSNFWPMVGIISGSIGLIIDQILQSTISSRLRANIWGLVIIIIAVASLFYVLKN